MNALQRLIRDYLDDHPDESYSSIARRGNMSRSTVYSAATTEKRKQTLQPETIAGLARGLDMPERMVRAAAADAAGYQAASELQEVDDEEGRLIIAAFHQLDPARKRELARRARYLVEEMNEASGDRDE